jgi:trehalose-phosphatase
MAVLAPDVRSVLENLAGVATVAIVSGRDVVDVMDKVGVSGLYFAGSHGFDIRTPSGEPVGDEEMARFDTFLPVLDQAEAELRSELASVPGSNVERKRFAIAVHYRQVPEQYHESVAAVVDRIAPGYPTLRVAGGKMIWEFRPDIEWDKGKALEWLLTEMDLDHPGVIPLYIGDDVTDEDAYRVLGDRGISIVVGREERISAAGYALEDTEEVRVFLDRLRVLAEGAGA